MEAERKIETYAEVPGTTEKGSKADRGRHVFRVLSQNGKEESHEKERSTSSQTSTEPAFLALVALIRCTAARFGAPFKASKATGTFTGIGRAFSGRAVD